MLRQLFLCAALALLAACSGGFERTPLPADRAAALAYVHYGPPSLTLITMINNRSGSGGHSSLMVNGSQRVIFDPAGTFRVDWIEEHGDVLYGMTDRNFTAYKSAHSRATHHVVTQEIIVSPEVAEQALRLVQARGSVTSALCANATSGILQQLPGFQDINVTFFPRRLMEQFATLPGVMTDRRFENDAGDVVDGIEAVQALRQGG